MLYEVITMGMLVKKAIQSSGNEELQAEEMTFFASLPDKIQDAQLQEKLQEAARHLAASHRPAVICGTVFPRPQLSDLTLDLALLLHGCKAGCRITSYNVCYTKLLR